MAFLKVNKDLFFSRSDKNDPRMGDLASEYLKGKAAKDSWVIGGYPDDRGIELNGGRVGAKEAPDRIRSHFYKMTPSLLARADSKIFDCGNLKTSQKLADSHESAIREVRDILEGGSRWLALGGGHDWGYVDGSAFLERYGDKSPLVINFDAHLDVRPDDHGPSSGTPFFRLVQKYEGFEFFEIGLQSQCNSRQHLEWLKQKGGRVLLYDELLLSAAPVAEKILSFLEEAIRRRRPTFLSVDIDAFSSAWAPGCSQSFATGLAPDDFFRVLEVLTARLDIRVCGIYEVSPPLDEQDKTSKLAAQIMHRLIS